MKLISQIIGGLGNQMFQYATGFACAKDKNWQYYLDTTSFLHYKTHHGFELTNVFECTTPLASLKNLRKTLGWRYFSLHQTTLSRKNFSFIYPKNIVEEPSARFWPGIFSIKGDNYLIGYWQSEKYFKHHSCILRKEFNFKQKLIGKNEYIYNIIKNSNSVSLHIRRGDYLKNSKAKTTHGVCSLEYYRNAINFINAKLAKPTYFIFSDDIPWAKENLIIPNQHYFIDHNIGSLSHFDLQLMSLCDNHITANSSFSWWGAWLSNHNNKIVVTPKQWYLDSRIDSYDLIPDSWIRL